MLETRRVPDLTMVPPIHTVDDIPQREEGKESQEKRLQPRSHFLHGRPAGRIERASQGSPQLMRSPDRGQNRLVASAHRKKAVNLSADCKLPARQARPV